MKIAVFHNLPPGGSKRTLLEEVKYLSQYHSLDVFEFSYRKNDYMDIKPYAEHVFIYDVNLGKNLPGPLGRIIRDFKYHTLLAFYNRRIARKINQGGYNFALIHTEENIGAPYILRYLKIPNLYFDQEITMSSYFSDYDMPKRLIFYKKCYEKLIRRLRKIADEKNSRSATLYATSSVFLKNYVHKFLKRESTVVYPGVDAKIFKKTARKERRVLFIGSGREKKDLVLVKKALKIVNKRFKVNLDTFEVTNSKYSIKNDSLLAKKYSHAICTLCLRKNEGFGYKAIESMACETPVIAVREGGYLETVKDKKTGFFVSRDSVEIARKIIYLINNPKVAAQMGKMGRADVIKNFSWEKHGRKLNKIISDNFRRVGILISGQDSGGYGGAENFSYTLGKVLIKKGFAAEFSVVKDSLFAKFLNRNGVTYSSVPFRMDIIGNWKGFIKFFLLLPYFSVLELVFLIQFKNRGGKIILAQGFSDKLILTLLAKIVNLRVIWVEYGPFGYLEKRIFGIPLLFYKLLAKYPDCIITPSENTKRKIIPFTRRFPGVIQVINIGIEILSEREQKEYYQRGLKLKARLGFKNKTVIGMLSRIEKGKGQDLLLEAVSLVKKTFPDIKVLIVGGGNIKSLKLKTKKLGLKKQVFFLGFWPDLFEAMSAFDVFVFPSTWEMEGFGIVLLEAMLLGLPIVTSNFGPIPEVVGDCAVLVKPEASVLAKAIGIVVKKLSDYRTKAIRSRQRVIDKFDIEKTVKKYIEVFESFV